MAGVLAATAVLGILGAGQANADVGPFLTPFVDPGCLCAGLLPGPVQMGVEPESQLGTRYIQGNWTASNPDAAAKVRYFALHQRLSITDLGAAVEEDLGPLQYGTYRGHPSFTTQVLDNGGDYTQMTAFIDGPRAVTLTGWGATPEDAAGALATLAGTFQIL
ncbi:hypothetical protein EBN03_33145 [Nocardia stercoris]|uniref:DUF3558 domain-containing protein n=1 Tax=Nocardia stercoris TaxID=2483361 RepID=A0A3M2KPX7_9NOCA|nr:hypothetical protein EBN03_33145 [Nocardia stercoris]